MRTKEENTRIATAVGEFMRVAMRNPSATGRGATDKLLSGEGADQLEKALIAFCAAVQDAANERVANASSMMREQFAFAALSGIAHELPSRTAYEDGTTKGAERQANDAHEIAARAWLLADAMMELRR